MDNTQAWLGWAQQPFDQGGLGLEPHQAAGIVGNLLRESGRGLPAWGPTGDNGTAWGTAQWRGDRLKGLQNYAANNGLDYRDPTAQMGFMRQELTGSHSRAYDALKAAKTPEQAATAFNRYYEISADNTGGREASARALIDGGDPLAAINSAAGIRPQGTGALAFSGEGGGGDGPEAPTLNSLIAGNQAKDNRFGLGDLFGASDETKAKMHGIGARLVRAAAALSSGVNPAQAAQFNALGKSLEEQNSPDFQYSMGANGQLVRINKRTGAVDSIAIPDAQKADTQLIHGVNPVTGQPYFKVFDKSNNTLKDIGGSGSGGVQAADTSAYGVTPTTDNPYGLPDTLEALKASGKAGETLANQVLAVRSGAEKLPPASGRGANNDARALRAAVFQYSGTTDENKFTARNTIYKNLNNKSASQLGGQLTQLGHSGDIMAQLGEDAVKLGNSNYRLANSLPAAIGNNSPAYQAYAGKAAAFDQKADGLIGELSKLYNGSQGGGVTERAIMRQNTPRASDPPEIIASKMQALRDLYESRMHEMRQQISAPFEDDADSVLEKYLPKSAQASLDRSASAIEKLHGTKAADAKAPAAPSQYQEGMTATGPNGQKIKFTNGQWVPMQ